LRRVSSLRKSRASQPAIQTTRSPPGERSQESSAGIEPLAVDGPDGAPSLKRKSTRYSTRSSQDRDMTDALTARQALEGWTAELARELGWPTPVSNDGVWPFQTPAGVLVVVEAPADLDILVFHTPLGEIADLEDAALLRGLLACNWFGQSTGPGQLGLEPGG